MERLGNVESGLPRRSHAVVPAKDAGLITALGFFWGQ